MIAAIHGYCLGAGIALVADCDLRIAADDALFGLPEVKLSSLVAFRQQVIRLVGLAPGMYMLLTGENINAQKALNWGLVYDVVPRAELMPAAEKVARIIASNPPLAVTAIKQAVHSETQRTEYVDNIIQSLVHELKNSEDSIEARKAFAEKRRPIWKGR